MISVIIPSRNEQFMPHTVRDLLKNSATEIEIVVVLDGYWPLAVPEHDRVHYLHVTQARGMRYAINSAAAIAKGDWLVKCDAHCMFAPGWDETLLQDAERDQIIIPRRKRLDAENWQIQDVGKPDIDLHYLSCPLTNPDGFSMHGAIWPERDRTRLDVLIDETPSFQGSFWMMHRDWFTHHLQGMSEAGYGGFTQEPQEIGMKTWLGGGRVVVNKKTWYAHLHKGKKYGRGYALDRAETLRGHAYSAKYWLNDKWEKRQRDFAWFVERFAPMPTWPEDWQAQWERHEYNEHRSVLA